MSKHFHVELEQDSTTRDITGSLNHSGITPREVKEVTADHDGYIFTQELVKVIWEYDTGLGIHENIHENQGVPAWEDLTQGQQDLLTKRFAQFLSNCRVEHLRPDILFDPETQYTPVEQS